MLKIQALWKASSGFISKYPKTITLVGDKSLSKRDFKRVSEPLSKFGVKFKLRNNNFLPLKIYGASKLKPIKYNEKGLSSM